VVVRPVLITCLLSIYSPQWNQDARSALLGFGEVQVLKLSLAHDGLISSLQYDLRANATAVMKMRKMALQELRG
jgi:hypothetical protein